MGGVLVKYAWLALLLVALIGGPACAAAPASFDMPTWLEGEWVRETRRGELTESWKRVSDNTMEGIVFVSSGDSIRVSEYLRIERFGKEVFYIAKPGQNPFPTPFKLIEGSEERVAFENPSHDFPQRIIYARDGDNRLLARIEGLMDGKMRGMDFSYERKK